MDFMSAKYGELIHVFMDLLMTYTIFFILSLAYLTYYIYFFQNILIFNHTRVLVKSSGILGGVS